MFEDKRIAVSISSSSNKNEVVVIVAAVVVIVAVVVVIVAVVVVANNFVDEGDIVVEIGIECVEKIADDEVIGGA